MEPELNCLVCTNNVSRTFDLWTSEANACGSALIWASAFHFYSQNNKFQFNVNSVSNNEIHKFAGAWWR